MKKYSYFIVIFLCGTSAVFAQDELQSSKAKQLYQQAQRGKWFTDADKLKPNIVETSDHQSFVVIWKAKPAPKHWIVSIHGTDGFATDDLALWSKSIQDKDVGIVCLQWWLGGEDYYLPLQIYREIDIALKKLGVAPNSVMFHGFSRGSANAYAVVAIDAGRGQHYFSLNVASSGGVGLDFPPNQLLLRGDFGKNPLKGTRWITVAGGQDPHPDRDGVEGMRKAAKWLQEQGAEVVLSIEDPSQGHGALMRNPDNTAKVLNLFLIQ